MGRAAGLAALLILLLAGSAGRARAADSLAVHAELGGVVESSNELFYEDVYTDTTFLGRRLHGTPETRAAAVASLDLARRGEHGGWSLRPDLEWGDAVFRATTAASLRLVPDARWRLSLDPRFEFSRDDRYDVDRRELRLGATSRARRLSESGEDAAEGELGGELLSTPGSTDPYLLAHRVAFAALGWEHHPLLGWDASLRAAENLRTFPDSTTRDHVEHQLEGSLRHDFEGGHTLLVNAELERRSTLRPEISSRDRFLTAHGELGGRLRLTERFGLELALEGEAWRYDQPDSVIDFDYGLLRARALARRELRDGFSLAAGPRAEWLATSWNPAEPYVETAGEASAEWLTGAHWWLIEPSGGWRAYAQSESGPSPSAAALHSSYAFAELHLLADQSLRAHLRARVLLDARFERHLDPGQDARSLYFSLDLRRLF